MILKDISIFVFGRTLAGKFMVSKGINAALVSKLRGQTKSLSRKWKGEENHGVFPTQECNLHAASVKEQKYIMQMNYFNAYVLFRCPYL